MKSLRVAPLGVVVVLCLAAPALALIIHRLHVGADRTVVTIPLGGGPAASASVPERVIEQTPGTVTAAAQQAGSQAATVTVGRPPSASAIPPGFLGISTEFPAIPGYGAAARLFGQTVANLSPGARPVIRIGGDSTDHSWIPVPGEQNGGLWNRLGPRWFSALKTIAATSHGMFTMGLNMEVGNQAIPIAEAKAFRAALGSSLGALEPGNEPDLYTVFPWYAAGGRTFFARRPSWSPEAYVAELHRVIPALGDTPLWGPSLDDKSRWWQSLPALAAAEPHLTTITDHVYGTSCYVAPTSRHTPTVAHLLSPTASTDLVGDYGPELAYARAHHDAFRIEEINTVTCAGAESIPGFASAIWPLQAGFALARSGVSGLNVQTNPPAKTHLFAFRHGRVSVSDEYYGWMVFARATPPGAHLLATSVSGDPTVSADATSAGGQTNVILINTSATHAATVTLAVPGSGQATVEALRGAGLDRAGSMSFAGMSISPTTGQLSGHPTVSVLGGSGRFSVTLAPASVDLVIAAP
ncbi:hypothetical protein [Conexibacter sp. DBS9H8]|uniref:hypothetical protein n=1 Tax=Conexibacter sp. DBS9H8 TaxID=2937801 RepID=UPI00200CFEDA|nr:hypothetical protein [Conexibacter sp. DBS9H8]